MVGKHCWSLDFSESGVLCYEAASWIHELPSISLGGKLEVRDDQFLPGVCSWRPSHLDLMLAHWKLSRSFGGWGGPLSEILRVGWVGVFRSAGAL